MFIDNDDDERKKGRIIHTHTRIKIYKRRKKKEEEEEEEEEETGHAFGDTTSGTPFHLLKLNGLFCYTKTVQNASLNLSHKTLIVD